MHADLLLYWIWICEELSLLASDASNQEVYLRAIGTWDLLDELGLEWEDYYGVLSGQKEFPLELADPLKAVDSALDGVPAECWRGAEALQHQSWCAVRGAAAHAREEAVKYVHVIAPDVVVHVPGEIVDGRRFLGSSAHSLLPPV